MVEWLRIGRKPERADAVREEHRHRRREAEEGEVVVPADGVIGQSHRKLLTIRRFAPTRPRRLETT